MRRPTLALLTLSSLAVACGTPLVELRSSSERTVWAAAIYLLIAFPLQIAHGVLFIKLRSHWDKTRPPPSPWLSYADTVDKRNYDERGRRLILWYRATAYLAGAALVLAFYVFASRGR